MEEMAVIKRGGKLYVNFLDETGKNIFTAKQPSEIGSTRK